MRRFIITDDEEALLIDTLQNTLTEIENLNPFENPEQDNYALIISGEALNFINIPEIETLIYQIA